MLKTLEIIPYTKRNGKMTLSDEEIMRYYDMIVEEGMSDIVFYNKTDYSRETFLAGIKGDCFFYILKLNKKMVGGFMLDGFQAKLAFFHYYTAKSTWGGLNSKIFKHVLKCIINCKNKSGEYMFDLLLGFTPVWHTKGHKFMKGLGVKELCTIPNSVYVASKKRSEEGKLFYFTRECCE